MKEMDEDEPPKKLRGKRGSGISRNVHGKMMKPHAKHFNVMWPTVKTETYVEMVFGSIQRHGMATVDQIVEDTKLDEDQIGVAIADLMFWRPTDQERGKLYAPPKGGRIVAERGVYSVNGGKQ